jgi:phage shock protein E
MSWLSEIFGLGNGKLRQAIQEGGVIVDLRTAYEYDQGHVPHALNIPIDRIKMSIVRLRDLDKPLILCCGNGDHCWEAAEILRHAGITRVYNGGSWQSVLKAVRSA